MSDGKENPLGGTCGECYSFERRKAIICDVKRDNDFCDFAPSRWGPRPEVTRLGLMAHRNGVRAPVKVGGTGGLSIEPVEIALTEIARTLVLSIGDPVKAAEYAERIAGRGGDDAEDYAQAAAVLRGAQKRDSDLSKALQLKIKALEEVVAGQEKTIMDLCADSNTNRAELEKARTRVEQLEGGGRDKLKDMRAALVNLVDLIEGLDGDAPFIEKSEQLADAKNSIDETEGLT